MGWTGAIRSGRGGRGRQDGIADEGFRILFVEVAIVTGADWIRVEGFFIVLCVYDESRRRRRKKKKNAKSTLLCQDV